MIHNSDKQRYDCGHNIYIKKAQHSEADKIFSRVSAYESFKSKLTFNSPVNPLSVRGRLRECKNPDSVWELKRSFVMALAGKYSYSLYTRVPVERTSILYESGNDSLNEK